ncbi:10344_t:CDS:2, partial [Dentiscutata heterogama]
SQKIKLKCTRLLTTYTKEQLQEIQEMIDTNFGYSLNAKQIPGALEFILEFVDNMLKEESKLDKRNKESLVPVNSPCKNTLIVLLNLESNKCESGKKNLKKEKSRLVNNRNEVSNWYSKSAKNDDSSRQQSTGQCYDKDINKIKSEKVAFKQYLKDTDDGIGIKKNERIGKEYMNENKNLGDYNSNENDNDDLVEEFECESKNLEKVESYSMDSDRMEVDRIKVGREKQKGALIDYQKLAEMNNVKIVDDEALDESNCVEDDGGQRKGRNKDRPERLLDGETLNYECEKWKKK